jgi:hypothetical protein
MSTMSVPDTLLAARAAQHAQAVQQQKARGLRLRRRRAHERRVHAIAAASAGVLLAGVLISGFYMGVISAPMPSASAAKSRMNAFAETKTGQLLLPAEGGWCKALNFNNTTGEFSNTKLVSCDDITNGGVAAAAAPRSSSYNTFTDSFKKR